MKLVKILACAVFVLGTTVACKKPAEDVKVDPKAKTEKKTDAKTDAKTDVKTDVKEETAPAK